MTMEVMAVPNDTRGWIMTVVSGIACVVGASIICVDLIICHIPGKQDFKIQESNVFLAASLSLSFGVMLFTSLYGMLPSSKKYLIDGGMTPSQAAWTLIGCFVVGFIGIQVGSRILHSWMPSHVVDCDHSHTESHPHEGSHHHSIAHSNKGHDRGRHSHRQVDGANGKTSESTPLLSCADGNGKSQPKHAALHMDDSTPHLTDTNSRYNSVTPGRRPSMLEVGGRVLSFVQDTKSNCDSGGPCFGYSDPCGQECFKHLTTKTSAKNSRSFSFLRTSTFNRQASVTPAVDILDEEGESCYSPTSTRVTRAHSRNIDEEACHSGAEGSEDLEAQHHHHVPQNAFLSIGLQTSFAIALHKLPEGFITYATNHANPALGFSVFMALFIHNISEGFAMALPLYLAVGNRLKAMVWASLLGGVSQPFGAGIAAIWFKVAGDGAYQPGERLYGCMFGITAGIMTSVALSLFVESLSLNHNRNLCIACGLIGMTIMGVSNALTA